MERGSEGLSLDSLGFEVLKDLKLMEACLDGL